MARASQGRRRPTRLGAATGVAILLVAGACGDAAEPPEAAGEVCDELVDDVDAARFEVFGDEAEMVGTIDASTPCRVRELFADHPQVEVIVMVDVPGSADDEANFEAAQLVHERGVTTLVPADGEIASGGVDFFAAGEERIVEAGGELGVHSWATGDGLEGADLPRADPEHDVYLDFYAAIGIPEEFYWFTLDAAPADGIHPMTEDELLTYGIATEVVPP